MDTFENATPPVDRGNGTILAEEVVRRSPAWNCKLIGGVLERAGK